MAEEQKKLNVPERKVAPLPNGDAGGFGIRKGSTITIT